MIVDDDQRDYADYCSYDEINGNQRGGYHIDGDYSEDVLPALLC